MRSVAHRKKGQSKAVVLINGWRAVFKCVVALSVKRAVCECVVVLSGWRAVFKCVGALSGRRALVSA